MGIYDESCVRGDGWARTIEILDESVTPAVPIDITGYIIRFTVKKSTDEFTDTNALIKKDITSFSDPTNGICVISLTSADTDIAPGTYKYDIQIEDASGGEPKTPIVANFTVTGDVTRRTRNDD